MRRSLFRVLAASAVLVTAAVGLVGCREVRTPPAFETKTYEIFADDMIHFLTDEPNKYQTVRTSSEDNGREVVTRLEIPDFGDHVAITARVSLRPVPKDLVTVYDRWDRAGHVRLKRDDGVDVEIMRFMTSYGGATSWELDVSHLAPLLKGDCVFYGFIDTWVSPAWRIDFSLEFAPSAQRNPDWVQPVFYTLEYKAEAPGDEGVTVPVTVPEGVERTSLYYVISGHCTDGMADDEFITKDNVVSVDGREVHRFRPWRDDCRQFRAINPYGRRWSNGDWSSDFSRSGWCPGDAVAPTVIDLDGVLPAGPHEVSLVIEGVRPMGDDGHVGYWRMSGVLVGWSSR